MSDLDRKFDRWQAAEAADDEAADAAFGELYAAALAPVPVPSAFTARTMQVVLAAAAQDAVRARRMRRILVAGSAVAAVVGLYFGAGPALSLISSVFVSLLDLVVAAVVWFASSAETRPDIWSVLASMGRAAGAFVADPKVTIVLLALQGIAVAAFIVLQRLLGSDAEYLK